MMAQNIDTFLFVQAASNFVRDAYRVSDVSDETSYMVRIVVPRKAYYELRRATLAMNHTFSAISSPDRGLRAEGMLAALLSWDVDERLASSPPGLHRLLDRIKDFLDEGRQPSRDGEE